MNTAEGAGDCRTTNLTRRGLRRGMCYVTRFIVIGYVTREGVYEIQYSQYIIVSPKRHTKVAEDTYVCRCLQVILRPCLSTRGRSDRQRLFLRHPFREELVFDVCLDYPTHDSAEPLQASKGKDSNFDVAC